MPTQPFVPVPGVTQVSLQYLQDGQHVENVYNFNIGGDLTATKAATMADYLVNTWDATMIRGMRSTAVSYFGIVLRDLTTQDAPVFTPQPSASYSGTSAGAVPPNNVTVAVKHVTGRGGKSYRGRTYHIGLTDGHFVANTLTSAAQTALVGAYAVLISSAAKTACGDLVVVSRKHLGEWRNPGIHTNVVSFSCNPIIDSQRRRLPERGK